MKGPMLFEFFYEMVNTEEIPSFLSPHQPQASPEYCLCILAMFTKTRKALKYVNQPSLAVFLYVRPVR